MDLIILFLQNFYYLLEDMSIYIIIGVLVAGILKQVIANDFVSKHLGKNDFLSVIKASLFGIPLPLCSCSVIPFASSLKKEGASSGSIMSFLISTPITGADSIMATYGFFGWIFTIYRVVTSFIIAIIAGLIQNIFHQDVEEKEKCNSCCSNSSNDNKQQKFSIKKVFDYAIYDIFKDFAKPLFFGLILGAFITTFLPHNISEYLSDNMFLTYILILVFSMPLYICATASLPIASALIASGFSGGVAFILLSAGPATNTITMSVVAKTLGKRALFIYISVISVFSLLFGYIFDLYFPSLYSDSIFKHSEKSSIIDMISSAIMLLFMIKFILFSKDKNV
jgi:uncharacterized membrane protein YraQ (UPF0718 family)